MAGREADLRRRRKPEGTAPVRKQSKGKERKMKGLSPQNPIGDSSEIERFVRPRIQGILNEINGEKSIDEIAVPVVEECDGAPDDNDAQQG